MNKDMLRVDDRVILRIPGDDDKEVIYRGPGDDDKTGIVYIPKYGFQVGVRYDWLFPIPTLEETKYIRFSFDVSIRDDKDQERATEFFKKLDCKVEITRSVPCEESIVSWLSGQDSAVSIGHIAEHFGIRPQDVFLKICEYEGSYGEGNISFPHFGFLFNGEVETFVEDGALYIVSDDNTMVYLYDRQLPRNTDPNIHRISHTQEADHDNPVR